jgi:hypothetical protein
LVPGRRLKLKSSGVQSACWLVPPGINEINGLKQ